MSVFYWQFHAKWLTVNSVAWHDGRGWGCLQAGCVHWGSNPEPFRWEWYTIPPCFLYFGFYEAGGKCWNCLSKLGIPQEHLNVTWGPRTRFQRRYRQQAACVEGPVLTEAPPSEPFREGPCSFGCDSRLGWIMLCSPANSVRVSMFVCMSVCVIVCVFVIVWMWLRVCISVCLFACPCTHSRTLRV